MSETITLPEFVSSQHWKILGGMSPRPAHLNWLCEQVRKRCEKEGVKVNYLDLHEFKPDPKTWHKFKKIVREVISAPR